MDAFVAVSAKTNDISSPKLAIPASNLFGVPTKESLTASMVPVQPSPTSTTLLACW